MIIRFLKKILDGLGFVLLRKHEGFEVNWVPVVNELNRVNLLEFLIISELNIGWNGLIQIGANDGVKSDPFRALILKYKLKAILIEPNPVVFKKLSNNYENCSFASLENSAINVGEDNSNLIPFYELQSSNGIDAVDYTGFSTLDEQVIKKAKSTNPGTIINKVLVNCLSVSDLVKKYEIEKISVLVIDAEGMDIELCKEFFKINLFPILIYIEILHQKSNDIKLLIQLFLSHNYLIGGTVSDLIAYRNVGVLKN